MIKNLIILVLATAIGILSTHYYLYRNQIRESYPNQKDDHPIRWIQTSSRKGSFMLSKNVKFRSKENVYLNIEELIGELIPLGTSEIVNFDDINSFLINCHSGTVYVPREVIETLVRDYIFNYPEPALRLESIEFPPQKDGENIILARGELKFVIWLNFLLKGRVSVDPEDNSITVIAEEITSVGTSYAKDLLGLVGLDIQKLIPIPEGRGLEIIQNKIKVKPFGLFPPPQLNGHFEDVGVRKGMLYLKLSSEEKILFPPPVDKSAKNYIYLYKGDVKFGRLMMVDARLQIVDQDPSDLFDFSIENYYQTITLGGTAHLFLDKSVKVSMPDFDDAMRK
ncbi:MAG: hypothetical protein H7A24_04015 [Leptospiraceae bacterium]|nr:hypothetical protein [Leptospiraceae bacterium]